MATHDYVIANGTGAAVRTDLNSALQAILTNNSGNSAPGTTAAGMLWWDSDGNQLYIRNTADDAWVAVTISGTNHLLPNGTVAAPSLAFSNDTNTGITNNGALNNFYISVDGTSRLALSGSAMNVNIAGSVGTAALSWESDWDTGFIHPAVNSVALTTAGAERMRIDSAGNVGIGTSSPVTYDDGFQVFAAGNGNNFATVQGRTDGPAGEANGVSIGASYGTKPINYGRIRFAAQGSAGQKGLMAFHTKLLEDDTSAPLERMRIQADGKIGIGTAAPDSLVEISSTAATSAKVSTSAAASYAELVFEDANAGYGFQVRSDDAQSTGTGSMLINDRDTGTFPMVIKEGNATGTLELSGSAVKSAGAITGAAAKMYGSLTSSAVGDANVTYNSFAQPNANYQWVLPEAGTYLLISSWRVRIWDVGGMILSRLYNNTDSAIVANSVRMNEEIRDDAYQHNVQISHQWILTVDSGDTIHHQAKTDNDSTATSIQSDANGYNSHIWYRIG